MIRPKPICLFAIAACFLASGMSAPAQSIASQTIASLPDAPQPLTIASIDPVTSIDDPPQAQTTPVPPPPPGSQAVTPMAHAPYAKRKWSSYVDPGERVPRLTTADKMAFWLHEEIQPASPLPALVSAEYGLITDSDPKYGTNGEAFGERFGAALARQASMRFFSDSVLPAVTHEDPRYYRLASGSYGRRAWHATERMFIAQNDDGRRVFDVSDIFGRLLGSALTMAYYPHRSANGGVVLRTWGTAVAGGVGDNLFLEFWPDIITRFRHRHSGSSR
ncbi:hypothetical protein [Paracidobacterium acidisoli]|uniref:Uncharacterized protein n=1 Tax=Paracidobacterium acidisoli TaxID=2303751 RepID=A0A372IM57_9BACT|nr:hypothetical protein [Paracidobacterium acidisoli]MBT9331661.1 hypothetical protein [Paracidobacterium acidisoli]